MWLALLSVVILAGCGDDVAPRDAATDDADALPPLDDPPVPEAPREPIAPSLTPCPVGWVESSTARGAVTCKPRARRRCDGATTQRPSDATCVPVGAPCPEGDFATLAGHVLYVIPTAASGGDGTRAAPFSSIADALRAAEDGDVIALGKGRFTSGIATTLDVVFAGACAAQTVIDAPSDETAIAIVGANVTVRDMTLRGGNALLTVDDGATVRGEGLVLEAYREHALDVRSSTATVTDVVIRDAAPSSLAAMRCASSSCAATHVEITRVAGYGALVGGGGSFVLEDAVIDHVSPGPAGSTAITAVSTDVDVSDVWFADLETALASTSTVRMSGIRADRLTETAIFGDGSASIVVSKASFHDGTTDTFLVSGGARLDVEDIVVERGSDASIVFSSDEQVASDVRMRRVWGERLTYDGVLLDNVTFALEDITLLDVLPSPEDGHASSGFVLLGATGTIARARVERAGTVGLYAGEGARVELFDLVVRDMSPPVNWPFGYGVDVEDGGHVHLERVALEAPGASGLFVSGEGSAVTGSDLRVSRVVPTRAGRFGRGVEVQERGDVSLERVLVEESYEFAAMAISGGTLSFVDATLGPVSFAACSETTCAGLGFGMALGAYDGGEVEIERFIARDAALCAAHVGPDGAMDLRDGIISGTAIGVCVEEAAFDVSRVMSGVRFEGDGVPLDSVSLPVPSPGMAGMSAER